MPTNLPHNSLELEKKYRAAKTLPEKIRALQEYISSIPEHKGTERLRAHLRSKLSKLREDAEREKQRRSAGAGRRSPFEVGKEGAAQVVLVGLTQTGKSSLLHALTNAKVTIDSRPYTSQIPAVGMMNVEDVQIQLVDTPAISVGAAEGKGWGSAVLGLCRNSDGILLVVGADNHPALQLDTVVNELRLAGIYSRSEVPAGLEVSRTTGGGIKVVAAGEFGVDTETVRGLLAEAGVKNAVVKITGPVREDLVKQAAAGSICYKPFLVALSKIDAADSRIGDEFAIGLSSTLDIVPVSTVTGDGLEALKRRIYNSLGIIRVYTRRPGQTQVDKPFILHHGATVLQLAQGIHTDLPARFRFAKVWGPSANYPGERIGLDRQLRDGDIVEIYAK